MSFNQFNTIEDSAILIRNFINPTMVYADFAKSVCGFIFNVSIQDLNNTLNPGLILGVNNIHIDNIRASIGTSCKLLDNENKIDFLTLENYGKSNPEWSLPENNIGYFIFEGVECIVVYGFFDENGKLKQVKGSISDGIWLYIAKSNNLIEGIYHWWYHPLLHKKLSGCRINALVSKSNNSHIIVNKNIDYTTKQRISNYYSSIGYPIKPGDIPLRYFC